MSQNHGGLALQAATRLEETYNRTQTEIQAVRASLKQPPGHVALSKPTESGISDKREELRRLLEERRGVTPAMSEISNAGPSQHSTDCVDRLKAMLGDCRVVSSPTAVAAREQRGYYSVTSQALAQSQRYDSLPNGRATSSPSSQTHQHIRQHPPAIEPSEITGSSNVFDRLMNHANQRWSTRKAAAADDTSHGKASIGSGNQLNYSQHSSGYSQRPSNIPPRVQSLEDSLMKRGEMSRARLEGLRREKDRHELAECRPGPKINRMSEEILAKAGRQHGNVAERLFEAGKASNAKKEMRRNAMIEQEKAEASVGPDISQRSRRLAGDRTIEQIEQWEQRRRKKLLKKREEKNEAEESIAMHRPVLSRRSEQIVRNMNRAGRVEDNLLAKHEIYQRRLEAKMAEEDQQLHLGRPQISVHSANLVRSGDFGERLYKDAVEKAERKKRRASRAAKEANVYDVENDGESSLEEGLDIDPHTGQYLFVPAITRHAAELNRGDSRPVAERLYEEAQNRQRRLELKQQAQTLAEQSLSHKPHVGPYSELLAELMHKRDNNESTIKRLTNTSKKLSRGAMLSLELKERDYTHRPVLSKQSRAIDEIVNGPAEGVEQRQELMYRRAEEYRVRRQRLKEKYAREEMAECTFAPMVTSTQPPTVSIHSPNETSLDQLGNGYDSEEDVENNLLSDPHSKNTAFVQRSMQWQKRRDDANEIRRQSMNAKRKEQCTFQPGKVPAMAHPFQPKERPMHASEAEESEWSVSDGDGLHNRNDDTDITDGEGVNEALYANDWTESIVDQAKQNMVNREIHAGGSRGRFSSMAEKHKSFDASLRR